ncbi:hypothetical protein CSUI_002441 [Cystoisospora suis]|uniref:Uncharacterized protein n=1 Tax=Cystoisospora suis TaxID=483139 RepID=A0A2C6KTY7_9APIC|nr:hypothetical protein CSUI_002441 [Cystoisospora suis]
MIMMTKVRLKKGPVWGSQVVVVFPCAPGKPGLLLQSFFLFIGMR